VSPLTRFKAGNHPQQVGARGVNDLIDDRGTDPVLFAALDHRFNFTLDVAAAPHNAKCARYFTRLMDGLAQPWRGERVWCNPPYSNIRPWVEKANVECYDACQLVVMLLPANRTEQGWWQGLIEPYRDKPKGSGDFDLRVEFLPGRPRFVLHGNGHDTIRPNERPPFGSCLVIWEKGYDAG